MSYVDGPIHEDTRCTRERRNGKTRILASFLLESPLLKEIAGDLDIPLSKNFIIYTVFHALSNDVIFINSARNKKFATCSYIRNFQLRTELTKITLYHPGGILKGRCSVNKNDIFGFSMVS